MSTLTVVTHMHRLGHTQKNVLLNILLGSTRTYPLPTPTHLIQPQTACRNLEIRPWRFRLVDTYTYFCLRLAADFYDRAEAIDEAALRRFGEAAEVVAAVGGGTVRPATAGAHARTHTCADRQCERAAAGACGRTHIRHGCAADTHWLSP